MGWWQQEGDGVWGDAPADVLDTAVAAIVEEFQAEWDRKPTLAEIRDGLEFSLSTYEDDAPHLSVVKS